MLRRLPRALLVGALVAGGLVATSGAALAELPDPDQWGPGIEGYTGWDDRADGTCRSTSQPGVEELEALVNREFAGVTNIHRACSSGRSEHEQGRALDWMRDASVPSERADAEKLIDWLLATDEHGNEHAMARRLGVMYIIYNGRTWESDDKYSDPGWSSYGSDDHDDHVHISFDWPGARGETSFFDQGALAAPEPEPTRTEWLDADLTGDGTDELVGFDRETGEWLVGTDDRESLDAWGAFPTRTGWSEHLSGDVDGDGRDEILSYHEAAGRWYVSAASDGRLDYERMTTFKTRTGWAEHLVTDLTGDGRVELASFHPSNGSWWVTRADEGSASTERWGTFRTNTGWQRHLVGDFDGDGSERIASFHPGTGRWFLTGYDGDGLTTDSWGRFRTATGWSEHLVGQFGDRDRDTVVSYHPGAGTWWRSALTGDGSQDQELMDRFKTKGGWQSHVPGDVNGDGVDDVISYHPGAGSVWASLTDGDEFDGTAWARYRTRDGWGEHITGDFAGRGQDVLASFHASDRSWWVTVPNGGETQTREWDRLGE